MSDGTKRVLRWVARLLLVLLLIAAGIGIWYYNRPRPDPITDQELFEGVTYTREIRDEPRPLVIHILEIDLDAPGIGFLVTPRDKFNNRYIAFYYKARTVSEFLEEFDVQIAINGDYFQPAHYRGPWDYYPHSGDGINPRGRVISQGTVVSEGLAKGEDPPTMFITEDNQISFIDRPQGRVYNAISGNTMLLWQGQDAHVWETDKAFHSDINPRTAVAIDQTGRKLMIFVVDGRQPNYSEGVNFPELADIILEYGGYTALNLDGGGSSTMVIEGEDGNADVLNSTIHERIPGWERPVANHLGIFAQRNDG